MKVVISVPGKYHAFDLARQLRRAGCLEQLITAYPYFAVRKYEIPHSSVTSLPLNQLIYRGWTHLPFRLKELYDPILLVTELFDRQARRRQRRAEIFVGWAGLCLLSLRRARERGAVTVIERGSSHMLFQQEIMRQEYELCGGSGPLAHPGIIKRELDEYREADYISVPSTFVKRTFLERGFDPEKILLNPYGVDLELFRPGAKEDRTFRVVFAGGMSLRKGVHYLLRAFAELNLPESELLLIGSASKEIMPYLHRFEGSFRWVGRRPQAELPGLFASGSVFVLPSLEEGLALVQLQAMASGLPLICTPNTGGEDLIEDGKQGFVVPIRDPEALKEKLLYLYRNHQECSEMGEQARERAVSGFSWDDYGQRMLEHYRRILNERQG